MSTKMRITILVPVLIGMLLVACLWPSNVVLYTILGCTIGLAVLATLWELHRIRKRQRLLPRMFYPSQAGLAASGSQVLTNIRDDWGYPPNREQVLEEILSGDQVGGGWDFAVHVHEGAEQYLGSAQFSSLAERFTSISGVDECKHEDREVFLVRTKSLDVDTLREACWKQFMEAAKAAFEKDKS
jgi:hypothetical protein